MIMDSLELLLGTVPVGMEPLAYMLGGFVLLFLLDITFTFFMCIFKFISGGKL